MSLRDEVQQSIDAGLARADTEDARQAFRQCGIALSRCRSFEDVQYVQGITLEIKRIVALYGVHATLDQAVRRLDRIVKA